MMVEKPTKCRCSNVVYIRAFLYNVKEHRLVLLFCKRVKLINHSLHLLSLFANRERNPKFLLATCRFASKSQIIFLILSKSPFISCSISSPLSLLKSEFDFLVDYCWNLHDLIVAYIFFFGQPSCIHLTNVYESTLIFFTH